MDQELKKHVTKTGTTTVGIVCKDGIVIAADKRATYGGDSGVSYIAGKDQNKIFEVNEDLIVTVAGVASDTRKLIKIVRAELKLKELKAKSKPTIKQAANLFSSLAYQNIRQPSMIPAITHFLLGGKDSEGFYLYDVAPDGFLIEGEDFAATGSGMIHCNPILDSEYKEGMTLDEGKQEVMIRALSDYGGEAYQQGDIKSAMEAFDLVKELKDRGVNESCE